ncbi:MAG: outer membrane protein assembly factor BamA [Verrucomicrobiales bacterium]
MASAVLAACLVAPLGASAQQLEEPKTVRDIEVQYVGAPTVAKDRILSNMGTKIGDEFSAAAVEQDVKTLYASGDINNIRINSEAVGSDGVRLIVIVETRAALGEVTFVGNEVMSDRKLNGEVDLVVGDTVDEIAAQEGQRAIEELYEDKGFPDARVSYSIQPGAEPGYSRVVYTIDEGEKALLREIHFEGNTVFSEKELRGKLELKEKSLWAFFSRRGKINNQTLEDDVDRVEAIYRNSGYLNASVTDIQKVRISGEKVDLVFVIHEGEKYNVGSVAIEGANVFSESELMPALRLAPGEPYSASVIESDISTLRDYYGSRGYAEAQVVPQIDQAGALLLDVTYSIHEGDKFYVRKISIEGNTKTQDRVIRRELKIAPGEEFNTLRLDASRSVLQNLGYFSTVEFLPTDSEILGYKDVNVTVTEKSTGTVNFGVGFSSIDSLVGFVDITQSNFDLWNWGRWTGAGQRFRAGLKLGTERRDFVMSLTEPWFLGRQLSLGTEVYYRDLFFLSDYFDQRNYGAVVSLRKPLGEFGSLRGEYRLQQVEIFGVPKSASDEIKAEEGKYLQSKIGLSFLRDSRDSVYIPRRGNRIELGTSLSGDFLGGDVNDYGFNFGGVQYLHLPFDTIFSLGGRLEFINGFSGEDPPIFDRLFLGGANDMRGFDYREVGPKDENGETIGGQSAGYLTAEYTFPLLKEMVRGALFYDVGFVNEGTWDLGTGNINSNWGLGIRLYLPVGPIRLDFGIPVQADEFNDSGGRFNFNIGYQF